MAHCPECMRAIDGEPGEPGGACIDCEIFLCVGCETWRSWDEGCADTLGSVCDHCWVGARMTDEG